MFNIHYVISVTEKLKCKSTKNIILGKIIPIIQYCITAIICSTSLPRVRDARRKLLFQENCPL